MIVGRGLGHTGGTRDKLEAIPGFRTSLTANEFSAQVRRIGVVIAGQSDELAPADGKLYALRDVTGTVESRPLIVASILGKKLAAGASGILFDVKCGRGAIMETKEEARELAKDLTKVARELGRKARAILTPMDQPLGLAIGNANETIEAAVSRARACNVNSVVVVGHTDTSGSAQYNMGLSERRASVVRDALVARGMSAGEIQTQAHGETDLARPTRDGVREPLNRRTAVTITFR